MDYTESTLATDWYAPLRAPKTWLLPYLAEALHPDLIYLVAAYYGTSARVTLRATFECECFPSGGMSSFQLRVHEHTPPPVSLVDTRRYFCSEALPDRFRPTLSILHFVQPYVFVRLGTDGQLSLEDRRENGPSLRTLLPDTVVTYSDLFDGYP